MHGFKFTVPYRTRFYGFSVFRPFLHSIQREVEVTDDKLWLTLTTTNSSEYKEEKSDYLPLGQYKFIYNDTWFLTFETKRASSSCADDLPPVVLVDPAEILPSIADTWPKLKTTMISFHVSEEEYQHIRRCRFHASSL